MWKKLLTLIFRIEDDGKTSSDELMMIVDEVQQDGNLEEDESELIKNAIEFTEHVAEDITTHRVDIEAVSIEATKEEISVIFNQTQFSRIPVFDGTIDNIIGVVHMKDFYTEDGITKKNLKEIITKPVFIQKTDKINDILKVLQKNKSHIAVVIDEYGGTHGIVTMEDILEELVGEIWDEHDEIIEEIKQIEDNIYEIDGNLDFDEFCKKFEITCETENNSTGGWAMEQISKMPEIGDNFSYENLEIKITETDTHRVTKLTVKVLPKSTDENNEEYYKRHTSSTCVSFNMPNKENYLLPLLVFFLFLLVVFENMLHLQ
jgi:CBS domain containing-hemolysin-like protein